MLKEIIIFILIVLSSCRDINRLKCEVKQDVRIEKQFAHFLSKFTCTTLPFDTKQYNQIALDKSNKITNEEVYKFICKKSDEKCFNAPDGTSYYTYHYCNQLPSYDEFSTIIYCKYTDPTVYYLATYDLAGNEINKIVIASDYGDLYSSDGIVDSELKVRIKHIEYLPVAKTGQNFLDGIVTEYLYQIQNNGDIEQISTNKIGVQRFDFE